MEYKRKQNLGECHAKKSYSYKTKKLLCYALKQILREKSFEKIHIQDLTDACQLNRQTFYYHFENMDALLLWSLQQDIRKIERLASYLPTWQERIEMLFFHTEENNNYFKAAYLLNSYGQQCSLLMDCFVKRILSLMSENSAMAVTAQQYSVLFFAVLEQWVRGLSQQSIEQISQIFTELLGCTYVPRTREEIREAYLSMESDLSQKSNMIS